MRVLPTAVALAFSAAALAGCSSSAEGGEAASSTSSVTSGSAAASPNPSASETAPQTPVPGESDLSAADQVKPQAAGMAVDAFADAVLDQLKFAGPGTLSDQLVTIAMSPLTRQMASSADITTRLDSKGARVILTLSGNDVTCKITVTDAPAARGVACVA